MDEHETPLVVHHLRREYLSGALDEGSIDPDPLRQFTRWLREAVDAGISDANAMTLATVTPDGRPRARMVLLKDATAAGFTFFTNYGSDKARELAAHPHAALVFHWHALERQVRIEGPVARVDREESERYFRTRPRGSRIAAWASEQCRPIADRAQLEARFAEIDARFPGDDVPCPPEWGGFRVAAERYEFWQGRESRLHDRFVYTPVPSGAWRVQRLMP